jgi:predicted nucleotidyltransferase component of viral defense system
MLRIAPDVFEATPFALKGGTAINLFVREMPRLSVDLDLVYVNRATPRQTALEEITASNHCPASRKSRTLHAQSGQQGNGRYQTADR